MCNIQKRVLLPHFVGSFGAPAPLMPVDWLMGLRQVQAELDAEQEEPKEPVEVDPEEDDVFVSSCVGIRGHIFDTSCEVCNPYGYLAGCKEPSQPSA